MKRRNILIISIIGILIILVGSTYAFFIYSKTISAFNLTSGNIRAEFVNGDNTINLTYAYPISDNFAKANLEKLGYVDFSINGNINDKNQSIIYEIYLEEDSKNTLDPNYIKVYLTDDTNKEIVEPTIYNLLDKTTYANSENGKVIYKTSRSGEFNDKYRIYVWIDSSYTQNVIQESFSFKVNLYAYNDLSPKNINEAINEAIKTHTTESCNPTVTDDNGTPEDLSDDTLYLSGTNDCVNFNYVWYSGKLWRITSINSDKTVKMITQDNIAALFYGKDIKYDGSYIYQFLNEDFYDTLKNQDNIIVKNASWNAAKEASQPSETTTVTGNVGLLNMYEYTKINSDSGYLDNGYNWWLLNSYNDTEIWIINKNSIDHKVSNAITSGVRPVVTLKSDAKVKGDGTKENPFTMIDDKPTGRPNEKLNNRVSGEYVNFDNKLYRIVSIEKDNNGNNITKLTSVDYVRDKNGAVMTKHFSPTTLYGNSENDDYWGIYLNSTWYQSISKEYRKMLVEDTYYLGEVKTGDSYKAAICEQANDKVSTKLCEKNNTTWVGMVGLPRIGEMFSSQLGYKETNNAWLLTPSASYSVRYISEAGFHPATTPQVTLQAARPSITLNTNVYIKSGQGTLDSPYEIGMSEITNDKYNDEVATRKVKSTIGKSGGVVGVTNDNQKATTDNGNLREYRYSGLKVKNYVYFNCQDGKVQNRENCEVWRIVGVFKDEKNKEHLKIVKNDVLSGIFPDTYTIGDVTYDIKGDSGDAYATYSRVGEHSYGDWSNGGLMYFLNTESDKNGIPGYLSKINSTYKNMIEDTKYYLGTVSFTDKNGEYGVKDTVIQAYQNERDVKSCVNNIGTSDFASGCHVWANNHATWTGKIGLLYPSDYGFTMNSENWTTLFAGKDSSWLKNANHSKQEWFISKVSSYNWYIAMFAGSGNIEHNWSHNTNGFSVRPTLYLKSSVRITGGNGENTSPYQLSFE